MENRAHALAVGIATLILVAILAFAFWWMSGSRQPLTEYKIISRQPVTGLNQEASVKFRGVNVGKVSSIALDPDSQSSIEITIRVDEKLHLTKDAYAELRSQGVTGLAYIDLNDPNDDGEQLPPGSLITMRPSLIDRISERVPRLVDKVESFVNHGVETIEQANTMMQSIDVKRLNQTLSNLEEASSKLGPALVSANEAFGQATKLLSEQNQQQFTQTLNNLQAATQAATPLLNELTATVHDVRGMTGDIRNSASLIGDTLNHETLPQLNELTANASNDARRISRILDMLEENPQSLLFGKPEIRPGPGESGFKPAQ
ncbi:MULTISPECIES: MlaD family protein [Methylobacillus]|uniref:Mammalian cell entry related protein n=1 Tax=Methylobacillus flagellatus (strain ATCC 51484 / DSM 6875 / VKM B-1610 / KT) TaxID=265072 RepID=Q1GYQ2_METFK|nr:MULTISPECIES: MlaD family protein [Methylobacillus]ABE50635.1 Mammalian cell entry related protein [Methylobacillus flagellatus KT]MPS47765.1 MCE family protein [Methylobacillus sp.]